MKKYQLLKASKVVTAGKCFRENQSLYLKETSNMPITRIIK